MRKLTIVLFALLVLGALGTFAVRKLGGGGKPADSADTAVVGRGDVTVALKETGVVEPRQTVAVKSKVSGKVREVLVAEGDVVSAGQLLAIVEPDSQATLTLTRSRLELRRRRLDADQKEREWRRQTKLSADGLASQKAVEEAERDFRTAENDFLQEKTALNILEREANQPKSGGTETAADAGGLTDYRIVAPIAGVVAKVAVKPGELATSGTTGFSQEGALLLELADQRQLEVVVNVNEIDVPKVKKGMPAKVTLSAKSDRPIPATVDRVAIAPVTDANKLIVYPIRLTLPERPPELRQGMSASVDLTLETVSDVVRVPVLAVGEKDGKKLVRLRRTDGTTEEREVTLGLRSDKFAEVRTGLAPKDVVLARFPKDDGAAKK